MSLFVQKPGLLTTIQDHGRHRYQFLGFSVNGPMDSFSMETANFLLQNDTNAAVIEMGMVGGSFLFQKNTVIAITGAFMNPKVNQQAIKQGAPIPVRSGDLLTFGLANNGVFTYLAVKNGFISPPFLKSRSFIHVDGQSSFPGPKIEKGDCIPYDECSSSAPKQWFVNTMDLEIEPTIRFQEGSQYDWFTDQAKETFEHDRYFVTAQSNRMGYRLNGTPLQRKVNHEMWTEATLFGSIQVPPNGQPVILMADRQPTGGYPKIGQVIQADLPKMSQLNVSSSITFKKVTIAEAMEKLTELEHKKRLIKRFIDQKWKELHL
ncbi:5-oxoprolinase subunit C family protein [Radiobacillus deserti]|uniref:Biotin-dependent carboxyltransferase n=1 Tax=Radiobacillus deserti TaxID=2594883 RepID=A0A516KIS8_9BACI|nr:biotin-dependent carboxyltransferase family protein [Radiobacillus deserti]QDP41304.1 biotin-dependent carboxyltransferase [Radiobacillus deserti]